jgi:hypothetical protein
MVKTLKPWTGTATQLLEELNRRTTESAQRRPDWFRRPRQLADALRRLAPALRQIGIYVSFVPTHNGRQIYIDDHAVERIGSIALPASHASPTLKAVGGLRDEDRDELPPTPPTSSRPLAGENLSNSAGRNERDARDELGPTSSDEPEPPFGITPSGWAALGKGAA